MLEVDCGTVTDEQDGSRKALADAQIKEFCEDNVRTQDALCSSFEMGKSELLQKRDDWKVKREQLRTERDEKASRCHVVLSAARRLVHDSTTSDSRLKELMYMLQLLYEDSWNVPVPAGPSLQGVEDDSRVRDLKSRVAMKEIGCVAALATAALSMRDLNALNVQSAESDSGMMHLRSEIGVGKQLRAEVTRLVHEVMNTSLIDTASMCEGPVERAYILNAQLDASACCKDAYKLELNTVKDSLAKTLVERPNLHWSFKCLLAKVQEASTYLRGELQYSS